MVGARLAQSWRPGKWVQRPGDFSPAFPGILTGSWMERGTGRTQTSTHMRCCGFTCYATALAPKTYILVGTNQSCHKLLGLFKDIIEGECLVLWLGCYLGLPESAWVQFSTPPLILASFQCAHRKAEGGKPSNLVPAIHVGNRPSARPSALALVFQY